jgi:hypothetical protein
MSINVAIGREKEVVRRGSVETKVVKPVLRATNFSKQYGSVTVLAERGVSACQWRIGIRYGGGLGNGNGAG